jgi:hypothetical protein
MTENGIQIRRSEHIFHTNFNTKMKTQKMSVKSGEALPKVSLVERFSGSVLAKKGPKTLRSLRKT